MHIPLRSLFSGLFQRICCEALLHKEISQEAKADAEEHREEDIGGVVDIEIQPGECDEAGQNQRRNAHLFIVDR